MISEKYLANTSSLLSAVWTNSSELTQLNKEKLTFHSFEPIPSNTAECNFNGPIGNAFFVRISEALSKLPSNHNLQLFFIRKISSNLEQNALFPAYGLKTKIFLIEKIVPEGTANFAHLLADLGVQTKPGTKKDYLELIATLFGQIPEGETCTLPDLVWEENYLKVGASYIKGASLTDLPASTWPNCLESLFSTQDEFICSLKLSVPDKTKARKQLETKRRVSHALSAKKASELSDLESATSLSASEEILIRVTQGKENLIDFSLSFFVSDSTLKNAEHRIQSIISDVNGSSGCGLFNEGLGLLPSLKSHLPGAKILGAREFQLLSGNLAHLIPLFLDFNRKQDTSSLNFVSRCQEISHLNMFSSQNLNFNSFVCGASGSGKSFLMSSILAGFKNDNPDGSLAIFDVGGSYRKITKYFGGQTLDLDPKSAMELVAAAFKRLTFQPNGFCKTLLENICGAGPHITHSHRVAIEDLLQICSDAPFRIKILYNEALEKPESVFEDIALWLRPFLFWDDIRSSAEADKLLDEKIRSFDFKNLESDPLLQRLSILILTQGIWDRLKNKSSEKTLIVFDEVWKFFSQASGFLEEMYRTFRKYGAGITSITQNMSDYGNDAFAKLVITNSFNRILLQGASTSELLVKSLDLGESDIQRFLSVASKKNEYSEFWLGTPSYSQILRLYPSRELFKLANTENIQKEVLL